MCYSVPKNHRMIWVGRGLKAHPFQPPAGYPHQLRAHPTHPSAPPGQGILLSELRTSS